MWSSRDTVPRIVPHFVAYLRKPFGIFVFYEIFYYFLSRAKEPKIGPQAFCVKSRDEVILKLHYISAMGTSVHEICTKYYGRYVTLEFAKYILERGPRTWSFSDGVISPKEDGEECMDCCNLPEHGTSPVIFCKRNFLLHCLCKKVISKAMLEFKSWKLYWCQRELKVIIISQTLHVSVQTSGFRSCLTHPMVNVLDNSSRWATCSI